MPPDVGATRRGALGRRSGPEGAPGGDPVTGAVGRCGHPPRNQAITKEPLPLGGSV